MFDCVATFVDFINFIGRWSLNDTIDQCWKFWIKIWETLFLFRLSYTRAITLANKYLLFLTTELKDDEMWCVRNSSTKKWKSFQVSGSYILVVNNFFLSSNFVYYFVVYTHSLSLTYSHMQIQIHSHPIYKMSKYFFFLWNSMAAC